MLVIWIVTESSYVHEIPVIDEITIYDNEEAARKHSTRTTSDFAQVHKDHVRSQYKET